MGVEDLAGAASEAGEQEALPEAAALVEGERDHLERVPVRVVEDEARAVDVEAGAQHVRDRVEEELRLELRREQGADLKQHGVRFEPRRAALGRRRGPGRRGRGVRSVPGRCLGPHVPVLLCPVGGRAAFGATAAVSTEKY